MSKKKKVSIEDVARRAKVSITTVSRVINNVPTVSPKNRTKVEEAIAFYKFRPNVSAQRLASGNNNTIGLVIPGYPGIFHSFYAIEIIRGVGHACESLRMDMIFHITNGLNPLNTTNVGGVVFADIIENRKQVEMASALGTPCFVINNRVDDLNVSYIAIDNDKGGQIAADYLKNLGHERMATITGNLHTQSGSERLAGFRKYIEAQGMDLPSEYVVEGDYSRRSARAAVEKLLDLSNPPTAIFAASDEMALEAIAAVLERGLKVPDDVSIIGFDDNPACLYGPVALTTIQQPLFRMAEKAVHTIDEIIQEKITGPYQEVMIPDLIVRDSCASPANSTLFK